MARLFSLRKIEADDTPESDIIDMPSLRPLAERVAAAEPYASRNIIAQAKEEIRNDVMDRINFSIAAQMSRESLSVDLMELVGDLLAKKRLYLNGPERNELIKQFIDDMKGLGPLEPLLADETVSEIMVNAPNRVYVERQGRIELTDVVFRDASHIMSIATRIVSLIGRRVDESTPLCDARLADGSRVNIIVPPLSIDGPTITIRKFSKKKILLDTMVELGSISQTMADLLGIFGKSRVNMLISGGTGSGKTTLLNALSRTIDHRERIVTIEDAAELQLQQPHVIRLETRPPNLEGRGEVTMRDLLKNALRMRPDRIIVGETRGGEAIDMLQAMNTGHDGSLSTIHANRPFEALMRLENIVGLATPNLSPIAVRQQIVSAIDVIIQVSRMRDGARRVTHIAEILGIDGATILMHDLFSTEVLGENANGSLNFRFNKVNRPQRCLSKVAYFGLEKQLADVLA